MKGAEEGVTLRAGGEIERKMSLIGKEFRQRENEIKRISM